MASTTTAETKPRKLSDQDRAAFLRTGMRVLARDELRRFSCYVDSTKTAEYSAPHQVRIAAALDRIERGEINRLFISTAPRHWKSSTVSEKFPAKYLGRHPDKSVILAANAQSLAQGFTRNIRDTIVTNERYHELFPGVSVRADAQGVSDWLLTAGHRSSCRAVGVGGTLSGRGAHLILIDDPMADKQAFSKLHRDAVWLWYQNVLRERLEPDGAIVLIMSRWHSDDLAGRILKASESGDGEKWETLIMPAVHNEGAWDGEHFTSGEALWPARWPMAELEKIRKAIGARAWAAKFGCSPRLLSGNILDSSKLVMIDPDQVPELEQQVRRWDLAFTENPANDFAAGVKMGRDKAGNIYLLHCRREQGRWPQLKPRIIATAQKDGIAVTCAIEANGTQLGYYDDIRESVEMRGLNVVPDKPEGSKEMRAEVWGSRLEDGIIFCVRAPWNGEAFDELDEFPNADRDDIVDSISGGWGLLNKRFRLMMV